MAGINLRRGVSDVGSRTAAGSVRLPFRSRRNSACTFRRLSDAARLGADALRRSVLCHAKSFPAGRLPVRMDRAFLDDAQTYENNPRNFCAYRMLENRFFTMICRVPSEYRSEFHWLHYNLFPAERVQ